MSTKPTFRSPLLAGLPAELVRLVDLLTKLPGLGERTALRYALALVARPELAGWLGAALSALSAIGSCSRCGYLAKTLELCSICSDRRRDDGAICVVASVQHLMAIERSGKYPGRYHVLKKLVNPLEGVNSDDIQGDLDELAARLTSPMELVVALSSSSEGDATALVIARKFEDTGIKLTRIARGLSANGEMADADAVTVSRAIEERTKAQ